MELKESASQVSITLRGAARAHTGKPVPRSDAGEVHRTHLVLRVRRRKKCRASGSAASLPVNRCSLLPCLREYRRRRRRRNPKAATGLAFGQVVAGPSLPHYNEGKAPSTPPVPSCSLEAFLSRLDFPSRRPRLRCLLSRPPLMLIRSLIPGIRRRRNQHPSRTNDSRKKRSELRHT